MGNPGRIHYAIAFALSAFLAQPCAAQGERPIEPAEKDAIRAAIELKLTDPESARYRWLPFVAKDGAYCGYVNAKNRFGGYAGFVPFLVWIRKPNDDGSPRVSLNMLATRGRGYWSESDVLKWCRKSGINMDPALATEK